MHIVELIALAAQSFGSADHIFEVESATNAKSYQFNFQLISTRRLDLGGFFAEYLFKFLPTLCD